MEAPPKVRGCGSLILGALPGLAIGVLTALYLGWPRWLVPIEMIGSTFIIAQLVWKPIDNARMREFVRKRQEEQFIGRPMSDEEFEEQRRRGL